MILSAALALSWNASAAIPGPRPDGAGQVRKKDGLSERLGGIRNKIIVLEKDLIDSRHKQSAAKYQIKKIQSLLALQREERDLGEKRLSELERTVGELEMRRGALKGKIEAQQVHLRKLLMDLRRSSLEAPRTESARLPESEVVEAPRRRVLRGLIDRGLQEVEVLRIDLADADHLENQIQEERQQIAYLFQDLKEQEGVLELSRQLQQDLIAKRHAERLEQLENYSRLKSAQMQVEKLIGQFNARLELERTVETEREANKAMMRGMFATMKGKLAFPVEGKVVGNFGRSFDQKSNLFIFKKGIDLLSERNQSVRAISAGKVAFSGELPDYGRVAIIDHGDHFYSLSARLGELSKKAGDAVVAGDVIGQTDDAATPVYFEIRARNVAVNPLQWLSN